MNGNGSFQFKAYEFYQTFHLKTLVVALVVASCTWIATYVVPAMQSAGGTWATLAGILPFVLQGIRQYVSDNTDKAS